MKGTRYHSVECFECGSRRTRRDAPRQYTCCDCGAKLVLFVGPQAGAYTLPVEAAHKVEETRREMWK